MSRLQTPEEKVGQWLTAFRAISEELNPQALRDRLSEVINTPIPQDPEGILVYVQRMNATMALARLVAANDRAAGTIAALLVQSGIRPAAIDYGDET